jgi:hypothetical protein
MTNGMIVGFQTLIQHLEEDMAMKRAGYDGKPKVSKRL